MGGGKMWKSTTDFNYKKLLCKKFDDGDLCTANCRMAHGVHDLRLSDAPPSPAAYKARMCHLFESGKFCPFGAACFDMHSPNERDTGVCLLYRSTGRCYFPDSCPLQRHPYATRAVPYVPRRSRHWREQDLAAK